MAEKDHRRMTLHNIIQRDARCYDAIRDARCYDAIRDARCYDAMRDAMRDVTMRYARCQHRIVTSRIASRIAS